MYVQCERCQAEYEFDDALVSERGTTVKCTSCGHQFKIRRTASGGDADQWEVTSADGASRHLFSSLKELQRAIVAKTVARTDLLTRSGLPPKPLASIAELEPFFEERRARNPSIPDRTPGISNKPPPLPPGASLPPLRPPQRSSIPGHAPPLPSRTPTVRPADAVPPPPKPKPNTWAEDTPTHALQREPVAAHPAVSKKPPPPPLASRRPPTPTPTPTPPPKAETAPVQTSPLPPVAGGEARISASDALRRPSISYVDPNYGAAPRRRVGGWVVGAALVAGVAVVGVYMSNNKAAGGKVAAGTASDPRVAQFLASGETALTQGNLELAKENLDKAGALAEKNPDVLLATARLSAARADLAWLRFKLLPSDSDEARLARQTMDDLASGARRAAEDAQKGAPEDAALLRVRVDALRISGDLRGARALVDRILPTGSQPETAYVLAALDLAETEPPWSVVIGRLRTAAAGEGAASRARAALVYALARSGDAAEARKELDRLAAQPRVHPLIGSLRTFVERAGPATAATGKDAGVIDAAPQATAALPTATPREPVAVVDVNRLPSQGAQGGASSTSKAEPGAGATGGGGIPSDPRTMIRQAEAAKQKRDYDRARTLYEAALARNGSDSEALAGLADVSRAQGDTAAAQGLYKRVLGVNPSYLPALVALADIQWDGGDKGNAQKAYREIVERFPEPAYPARVKPRAEAP